MKKNVSSILVMVLVLSIMLIFTGCEKLKMSNLESNYHLKLANKAYQDEQYKVAVKEYEEALKLNPNHKFIYIYLGTAYSQIYKPGKENDPRNKDFGDKAISNLLQAKDFEPENPDVIIALGDMYDKLGQIDEAQKFYMQILEKNPNDPKSYYTLANFFSKNGKNEEAEEMYKKRIEMDPKAPEGYHYYLGFLQNQRRWAETIENYKRRLYAILDPTIVIDMREVEKLTKDADEVDKIQKNIDVIRKNKVVDQAEKDRLIGEAQEKLKGKLSMDQAKDRIAQLNTQIEANIKKAESSIPSLDEQKKIVVAECYYGIGQIYWNWSYQTPKEMMAEPERNQIFEKGMAMLNKSVEVSPDYAEPYAYMGLLYREKANKIDPTNAAKYLKLNEEFNKKFTEIYSKKKKAEALNKQLEEESKKAEGQ